MAIRKKHTKYSKYKKESGNAVSEAKVSNINFTEDGNIIIMNDKKNFTILSGSDLTLLKIPIEEETFHSLKQIENTNWLQYDYFLRGENEEYKEIVTFFEKEGGKNYIKGINIDNL